LLDIDLLGLEIVGDTSKGIKGSEVTSAHILHVCDVVVDNFKEPASLFGNVLNDVLEGLFVEGLGNAARVDGAHRVVGASGSVTFDSDLHGKTTVEDDRH